MKKPSHSFSLLRRSMLQDFVLTNLPKKMIVVMFVSLIVFSVVFLYDSSMMADEITTTFRGINLKYYDQGYLVSSPKCKIVDREPFSEEALRYFRPTKYRSCSTRQLLSFVTKERNVATVHIRNEVTQQYTTRPITCCYSNVSRVVDGPMPDHNIAISSCETFRDNVTISSDAVIIQCKEESSKKLIYENAHAAVTITENVRERLDSFGNKPKPLNVLMIAVDSVSRLNFIRTMPKTYSFIERNNWLTLKGYNKVEDNTFPNFMAIFTGYNQSDASGICNPEIEGKLDSCPFLWQTYRDLGYVTAYVEDEAKIGTFTFHKKGFSRPPCDYYFRPYILASEKLAGYKLNGMTYCTGPESAGERILNLAKDFSSTFAEGPYLGVFWMNSFSHNELNSPMMLDEKITQFLIDLNYTGTYDNTIVILFSDHGIRFGNIRTTKTGWLEERLPFIYFSFPSWFKKMFPAEYQNFVDNERKLTTPYDFHMTLQDILILSGLNHEVTPSQGCPNCKSLFDEIPVDRSCEEAGIEDHWCTCAGYADTSLEPDVAKMVSDVITDELHKRTSNESKGGGDHICAKFSVKEFLSTRLSQPFSYKNDSYLLVSVRTEPSAVFETTLRFADDIRLGNFFVGYISRLDAYAKTSKCASTDFLKKYCYCLQ
ncbi:uncharacterized protein LOC132702980 [Cylas formicarius]|uniref:uncharacterized protein LOC132702980 n=1 Tax=Cylas formicarius TaxID=197179 RepID=UPI00295888A6|nr:uncharacterized protein LOC132702980 [Cylas formicarius]